MKKDVKTGFLPRTWVLPHGDQWSARYGHRWELLCGIGSAHWHKGRTGTPTCPRSRVLPRKKQKNVKDGSLSGRQFFQVLDSIDQQKAPIIILYIIFY